VIGRQAGLSPCGFIAKRVYRQWLRNSPIGNNGDWRCVTVDVTIFVAKRCELETEVFRRWVLVFEKFAN